MVGQAACWQPHERGWAPKAWHYVSRQGLKQFFLHLCTLQRSACKPILKQHLFSPNAVAPIDDTIVAIVAGSAVIANNTRGNAEQENRKSLKTLARLERLLAGFARGDVLRGACGAARRTPDPWFVSRFGR